VVLALLLLRAKKAGALQNVVATIFEPVSERGKAGMDELHEQTVNLLSFQQMPKHVFDVQVAFNLLTRYGEKAATQLESIERRIVKHFKRITHEQVPVPPLVLLQSAIFHAYMFSIYIELEEARTLAEFSQAVAGEHIKMTETDDELPNNVNVAGEDDIMLSVRTDATRPNGFWLWAAADNLKLAALTAVDCAAALALTRSRGSVQ